MSTTTNGVAVAEENPWRDDLTRAFVQEYMRRNFWDAERLATELQTTVTPVSQWLNGGVAPFSLRARLRRWLPKHGYAPPAPEPITIIPNGATDPVTLTDEMFANATWERADWVPFPVGFAIVVATPTIKEAAPALRIAKRGISVNAPLVRAMGTPEWVVLGVRDGQLGIAAVPAGTPYALRFPKKRLFGMTVMRHVGLPAGLYRAEQLGDAWICTRSKEVA